ncbi:MAG: ABC transporter permease [Alphaproteobacteria bacterium]
MSVSDTTTTQTDPQEKSGLARAVAFWRNAPRAFRIGAVILVIHILIALLGWVWTPYDYVARVGIPLSGMSWEHPFGVDQNARDIFSRVLYGGHIVILLAVSGTLVGVVVGSAIGLTSGYLGGWFDEISMRIFDAFNSIPFLVLGLLASAVAGPVASGNPLLLVGVVALVYAPRVGRIARSAAQTVATQDYVLVARLRRERVRDVVRREILPNCSGPLLVEFALRAGYAPVLIGSLGFLGFGVRAPLPEWGRMIAENRNLIFTTPEALLAPGIALATLVVGLNLFTDGIARMIGRTTLHAGN